jgi:multidrug efflux pump subunit AcrA (membrane-fusion protein)
VVQPVPVSTIAAVKREIPIFVDASGSLTPFEQTDVAPPEAGKVVATPVDAGSFVQRGQVLARLDDRDARLRVQQAEAAVAQAEAAVTQARANLGLRGNQQLDPERVPEVASARSQMELAEANERRYRSLVETGDIPQAQYDEYKSRAETARKAYEAAVAKARSGGAGIDVQESAVQAARAQLALARKALADTVITAPLSGYVVERPTAVGEWVTTSSRIATIVQNGTLKLLLQVAEADAARVHIGVPVQLRVDAFPDREFSGTVSEIIPALDPASRALIAVVGDANPDGALKPGMFATARVVEPSEGNTGILVPASAVIRNASGTSVVYVVRDNHAEARAVQTGEAIDAMIQIVDGVAEGEEVVTAGAERLSDGTPITKSAS